MHIAACSLELLVSRSSYPVDDKLNAFRFENYSAPYTLADLSLLNSTGVEIYHRGR